MSLKLACPRCRHVQFFDDALAGQPAHCARCDQPFRVPRLAEPAPDPAPIPTSIVSCPAPVHLQARELPTSFEPPEIATVKVVEVPVQERPPRGYREIDESLPAVSATASRRPPRPSTLRRPPENAEPRRVGWSVGVSLIAFFLLVFAATAAWFLLRDDRRQQAAAQQPNFQNFQPQPFNPPRNRGMRPQFGGPVFPLQRLEDPRHLEKGKQDPVLLHPNEKVTSLKLTRGHVQVNGMLTANDPAEPFRAGCHRKIYTVELEAKRKYFIELLMDAPLRNLNPQPNQNDLRQFNNGQGLLLDSYVILEDQQGIVVAFNDDVDTATNQNSRIDPAFEPPATATYRIIATSFAPNQTGKFVLIVRDENMGKPVAAKALPAIQQLPRPIQVKQPLPIAKIDKRNLSIATILQSERPLAGNLCWSADGGAYFALDEEGTLRRITWPANLEERRLETGQLASSLAMSRAGLLIGFPKTEEVWVIDPETLRVRRRISAPGLQTVAASPALDIAFAGAKVKETPPPVVIQPQRRKGFVQPEPAAPQEKDVLLVLDAAKGAPVSRFDYSPKHAAVTPDGKFLFTEGGIDRLQRYRINGFELTMEEESPRLAAAGQGIFISPDSKFVCLPSPGGNYAADPQETLPMYTVLVFPVGDLKHPAASIKTDEAPRTVGFDAKSEWIFAHNNVSQFMRFNRKGVRTLEETLPGMDRAEKTPRQFLTHPNGDAVLILTARHVYVISWNRQEPRTE